MGTYHEQIRFPLQASRHLMPRLFLSELFPRAEAGVGREYRARRGGMVAHLCGQRVTEMTPSPGVTSTQRLG
jgi:hypothetical protein